MASLARPASDLGGLAPCVCVPERLSVAALLAEEWGWLLYTFGLISSHGQEPP
ncbi:hypothetical protein AB0393_12715 [Streptomyces cyaneofuscatus]|uniref:Uncharacterized protein n=1 Tax=Streptomyces bacillaris TaxID=68179 RepID=A0ABW6E5V8_9ACTN|nr:MULTISPECIES: hypothetical protein [Streptomyces]ONI49432.1 hypothetical protein STIB_65220 [Streptomyces sp. IB2014 011-1]UZI27953.1 hypothetical protein OH133_07345 [Streptomyces sp. VB1]